MVKRSVNVMNPLNNLSDEESAEEQDQEAPRLILTAGTALKFNESCDSDEPSAEVTEYIPESFVFDRGMYTEWTDFQARTMSKSQRRDSERERMRQMKEVWMKNHFVLSPESPIRRKWDAIQIIALMYVAIVVPYRIGFDHDTTPSDVWFYIDVMVDLYFIADIFLSFRTAFYNEANVLVVYPRRIAVQYVRGWFTVDIASCLPLNYLAYIPGLRIDSSQARANKTIRMLRLLRLLKLLRLARFNRLIARYQEEFYTLMTSFRILKIFFTMMIIGHWLCCCWFYIGAYDTVLCDGEPQINGVCEDLEREGHRAPDGSLLRGWVHAHFSGAASNASYSQKYVAAMYWAMMTMTTVGYGDISANTHYEMVMSVCGMILGGFVFGTVVGNLSEISRRSNPGETIKQKQISKLANFLHSRGIDNDLTRRVRSYYLSYYNKRSAVETLDMLTRLPIPLRHELLVQLGYVSGFKPGSFAKSSGILDKIPFFTGLDSLSTIKLCMKLKTAFYEKETPDQITGLCHSYIMREGDPAQEMFIIEEGEVTVEVNEIPQEPHLTKGDFFGELSVLVTSRTVNKPRVYTRNAFAVTPCTIALLAAEDAVVLAAENPAIESAMRSSVLSAETNQQRHAELMQSSEPTKQGYVEFRDKQDDQGWLPTMLKMRDAEAAGPQLGALATSVATTGMAVATTIQTAANDATGGVLGNMVDTVLGTPPSSWKSVYANVESGKLWFRSSENAEINAEDRYSLVGSTFATSAEPVDGQSYVFQVEVRIADELENDKAKSHMLTLAVKNEKKLRSWLRVIHSNSKPRNSVEINDGMCTPRGGRRVDESYVPSSSEKIDLLTDRMNAMQGQLSNIERLLAQVPGVKAE